MGLKLSVSIPLMVTAFLGLAPPGISASEPRQEGEWTTIRERLGEWSFLTLIPPLAPLLDEEGQTLGLAARDCGACHDEVYAQWRKSTHASALQDLQFLAELAKPDSPRWLCLNCHIPLQNQRRYLVQPDSRLKRRAHDIGLLEEIESPFFDAALEQESVTCASCHVRPDEGGRSLVLSPGEAAGAPHPVLLRRDDLRGVCIGCHSPGPVELTPVFFCWFETAEELASGPWSGKADCVDCHMPGGRHHWVGGGVPKSFAGYQDLLERGWKPGLEVGKAQVTRKGPSTVGVRVTYANARAGHWLPTADPERFLLFIARLLTADGQLLSESRLRIGQRWDWGDARTGRPARRLADNRLRPEEERTWEVTLESARLPESARLQVLALHVRLTPANASHMKGATVEDMTRFRPDVVSKVRNLEEHYPMFTWVHREEIDIDTGSRSRWTLAELVAASRAARTLSPGERLELLREPDDQSH